MRVVDRRAAAFLCNQANLDLIGCLIERECSLADLSQRLQEPINNIAPKVHRMVEMGLARVARVDARRGRPIKRFCMCAERFLVPMEDGSVDGLARMQKERVRRFYEKLLRQQAQWMRHQVRDPIVACVHYREDTGMAHFGWWRESRHEGLVALRDLPYSHGWGEMLLAPADVEGLRQEMSALAEKYMQRNQTQGQQVMFMMSAMPVRDVKSRSA